MYNSQHLCYAPNSFGMIVGNLIFGDLYSTLWPSTSFHYIEMVKLHVPHEASRGTWLLTLCGKENLQKTLGKTLN